MHTKVRKLSNSSTFRTLKPSKFETFKLPPPNFQTFQPSSSNDLAQDTIHEPICHPQSTSEPRIAARLPQSVARSGGHNHEKTDSVVEQPPRQSGQNDGARHLNSTMVLNFTVEMTTILITTMSCTRIPKPNPRRRCDKSSGRFGVRHRQKEAGGLSEIVLSY